MSAVMFGRRIMQIPRKEKFPKGTQFYIKEFDVPLVMIPEGNSAIRYNWFGGEVKIYDFSHLKLGSFWEAEYFFGVAAACN